MEGSYNLRCTTNDKLYSLSFRRTGQDSNEYCSRYDHRKQSSSERAEEVANDHGYQEKEDDENRHDDPGQPYHQRARGYVYVSIP